MSIKILDCTLRDGAYVVDSVFGQNRIKSILSLLSSANIDIIECGWLRNCEYQPDSVSFNIPENLKNFLPDKKKSEYSLMFDFGKYDITKLSENSGIIDIIRVSFYKKDLDKIEKTLTTIKKLGYKLFLQPSNIKEYSDKEIEQLCSISNTANADSVYIVDSFGSMFPEDLDRIMKTFDKLINKKISIGFHSHNSIQLSMGLSLRFIEKMSHRNIFVDSTLCGLGRGAGNAKTEILCEYLNRIGCLYPMEFIHKAIESDIKPLYSSYDWEYTPERGYKGIKGQHPCS